MSMVSTSYQSQGYTYTASRKQNTVTNTEQKETAALDSSSRKVKKESAVQDFIRRNPNSKSRVMEMVRAGEEVRKACGVEDVDTQSMSMLEYREYITKLLGNIRFAPSRPYDEETVFISEEGWEQMKNDPEYEAWVLGYTKVNRSVEDPFFGMGSYGSYAIEHFGASIDEHNGHGYSKIYGGSASAARSLFQAESRGGMTYRASKSQDITEKLEEERLKKKRLQKKKKEKKAQEEKEEHMRMMRLWARQSAMHETQVRGISAHDARMDLRMAAASYETGFLFQK